MRESQKKKRSLPSRDSVKKSQSAKASQKGAQARVAAVVVVAIGGVASARAKKQKGEAIRG